MNRTYSSSFAKRLVLFVFAMSGMAVQSAYACHGVPLLNLQYTLTATGLTITATSDPNTNGCGNYYMQAELICNALPFTGTPTHSTPGVPWTQPINYNITIPFSQMCPGVIYKVRVREYINPTVSPPPGPWMTTFTFTAPGTAQPVTATASASQTVICPGNSTQLSSSGGGGGCNAYYTFQWTPATGLDNPNIQNPVASPTTQTTYTVTVTDACTNT